MARLLIQMRPKLSPQNYRRGLLSSRNTQYALYLMNFSVYYLQELRFQTKWVQISSEPIHSCAVNELQYFVDGKVGMTTSDDPAASIVLFWPIDRKAKTILKLSHGAVCVTMSRSRRTIVAGCRDGSIKVWPFPPSVPPDTLRGGNEHQLEVAIRDVRFVSGWVLSIDDKGVNKLAPLSPIRLSKGLS